MEDPFVDLLQSLTNDAEPALGARLAELSDMDSERLAVFASIWTDLPAERRQTLLEELGLMADAQIELTFEGINRIGVDDPDSGVRLQAIENLWECEDPELARKFVSHLQQDTASEVRATAGKALGLFILIGETRELDPTLQTEIEEALLSAARTDSSEDVRNMSLQSLGYSSRPEVPELIEQAYASKDTPRIFSALQAISRSANPDWGEKVLPKLHDHSPKIRLAAVRASGDLDLRESIPDLIELLEDVDEPIRRAAMWSLSQIGGTKATEALNAMAEEQLEQDEAQLLQDAIDNLVFVEGARELFPPQTDDPQELQA